MEVKTNKEYTTMQHEIATAEEGVRTFEDQILTLMMEADELTAAVKAAEAALAAEERNGTKIRTDVDAERGRLENELAGLDHDPRRDREEDAGRPAAAVQRRRGKRRGIAVSAIRDGHCHACQVTAAAAAHHGRPQGRSTSCSASRASASSTCPPAAPGAARGGDRRGGRTHRDARIR